MYAIEAKLNFNQSSKKHLKFFAEKYKCETEVIGLKGAKRGKYIWEFVERS